MLLRAGGVISDVVWGNSQDELSGPATAEAGTAFADAYVPLLRAWVADDAQSPNLSTLPANSYVKAVAIQVTEAFNSNGTDTISVGYDADPDAFAKATDVSTAGIKTVKLGVLAGYNGTARAVKAYYVHGGTEPVTGKALVTFEYQLVPGAPA